MNLDFIKDNTLIICPNDYKKYILEYLSNNHIFLNVKFFLKETFFQEYLFKYDEQAIYYLVSKYNYKIGVAKEYLDNIKYIDSSKLYKSKKLIFLQNLKKELESNKLLIYNDMFLDFLNKYQIVVLGYDNFEDYEKSILESLNSSVVDIFNSYELPKVYEFLSIKEELDFVCQSICKLIKNGTDINNIKIMGLDDNYYNELNRLAYFYNIPIKIPTNNLLINNDIVKSFLQREDHIEERVACLKDSDSKVIDKIISICNKYVFIDDEKERLKFIEYDFKNIKVDNYCYEKYVDLININSLILDSDYVFLVNFNEGNIPRFLKDEDLLNDLEKEELGLKNTIMINNSNKEYLIKKLKSIKNLVISLKTKDKSGECYPSSLIKELKLEKEYFINNSIFSYSKKKDLLDYANMLDNYELYGILNESISKYHNTFKDYQYKSYDNSYKKINKDILKEYLNAKLTLSYSSLANYNKCAFRFYLNNILKLSKKEDVFEAFIGSLFHDVLEKCLESNNVDEEVEKYVQDNLKELTFKDKFYIKKIKEDIKFVINAIKEQNAKIGFKNVLKEQNIVLEMNDDYQVKITGFIDKILYKEQNDHTLVSLIDYKTGSVNIDLKYIKEGLNMQLPIYLYLVKKSNLFKNPSFVGFYLQYILNKDVTSDKKSTYDEKRKDNLKLVGYSNSDISLLDEFIIDSKYDEVVKSLKLNAKNDFYAYSKVLNNDDIDEIISITNNVIEDDIQNIKNANFQINPKKINYNEEVGCEYCEFKDICFKKDEDFIYINKSDIKSGDDNA